MCPDEKVIALYCDHATSEQFHSEFKTDLDIERLPSGKFTTNDCVMALAVLAYNMLRWIGLRGTDLRGGSRRRKQAPARAQVRGVLPGFPELFGHLRQAPAKCEACAIFALGWPARADDQHYYDGLRKAGLPE
jgi:hypothetical protein